MTQQDLKGCLSKKLTLPVLQKAACLDKPPDHRLQWGLTEYEKVKVEVCG